MSDRRAKYIILASIIFVGIVGISQGQGLFELTYEKSVLPNTSFGYLGHVTAVLKDSDGNIKAYQQADNTVVNSGRDCAADLVFNTQIVAGENCNLVTKIAIGTSTASVLALNTALADETTNGKTDLLLSDIILTMTAAAGNDATLDYEKTFTILVGDSGESFGETGLFDEADNMFARAVFLPGIPVTTGDKITIKWELTVD